MSSTSLPRRPAPSIDRRHANPHRVAERDFRGTLRFIGWMWALAALGLLAYWAWLEQEAVLAWGWAAADSARGLFASISAALPSGVGSSGSAIGAPAAESLGACATDPQMASVTQTLNAFASGTLGKMLSIATLMIGLAAGITKASPVPALVGIAMAVWVAFAPQVMMTLIGC